MLSNWFDFGCMVDKSYTIYSTVDCVQNKKDFAVIIGIELQNCEKFLVYQCFSWIDLSENAAAILKSMQNSNCC